ncbi:hypothetical protein J5N97_024791 [Dioscorea zingiberensis]|uniref:Uncharacterized protein n=1 Tax=Dioscorea zingiberensis TaxID=325984 RepID=A0A9D5C838_9LILI|nr:hypothetical protein J5N97_024791 [Dioscorea zingiberensis]
MPHVRLGSVRALLCVGGREGRTLYVKEVHTSDAGKLKWGQQAQLEAKVGDDIEVDMAITTEKYYNDQTLNMTRASIINDITNLAILAVGNSSLPAFKDGFKDPETNTAQIISFKYGCSRGVASTPTFLVNGFALP